MKLGYALIQKKCPKTHATSSDFDIAQTPLYFVGNVGFLQSIGDVSLAAYALTLESDALAARLYISTKTIKMQTNFEVD
ncbi:MAG: hypothetical protein IJU91_01790 [Selenomonadaceae bacterium]|nr:hypothetical protein [Selenomonadaceae bacterium]